MAILGASWAFEIDRGSPFFGLDVGRPWKTDLGPSVDPSWGNLGPVLGHLGLSCSHLGAILGPSWAHLGPILGFPGAILAEFMQNLLGQISRNPKFAKANFRVTQNLLRQILRNAKFASANFV